MARFGDLDTQYLDDAGDPLVNGKVYFYESGTTTLKNTFADVNLSIPNTNPVILTAAGRQPNIFFDGVAKAILTSNSDVQILVRDPVGETATDFGDEWVATKIYGANDVVLGSDGVYYRSLVSGNQNNNPVSTTNFWTLLYSVEWNAGITYQVGAVVTYDGEQYQSLQSTNLNQNPSTASSYWVLLSFAWLATATYSEDQNAVGTDGVLYTSLQDSNTGNDPATSPAYWVGTSAAAAASATAAAASATAAAASETAAEAAETNAETAQTAAEAAQAAAETAETNAETAETNAASSATAAASSASAASTSATNAATSATNAASSATAASGSASAAATSATNASNSASAAAASETAAETAETNAETAQAAAEAAQSAAETAETNAETAETNAASSASAAATSASNAATSASNSATSATASASSASASASSAAAAASTYDDFDDRYLGDKASDPTLDNDGNALLTGALYFNTTSNVMRVYNGSAWQDTAISPNSPTFTGTVTADGLSLGDNDKAQFGNSNDLEIYHDGSNNYVDGVSGAVFVRGSRIDLRGANNELMLVGNQNGSLISYYDNSAKLATTSTGIDVTGTATMDGLTVDGNTTIDGSLLFTGSTDRIRGGLNQPFSIDSRGNASGEGVKITHNSDAVALFDINGDISFYEDTGTTPKFFWDASAERLGLGTSSPSSLLHVQGGSSSGIIQLGTGIREWKHIVSSSTGYYFLQDATAGSNRITVDTSGNVGIGSTSPNISGFTGYTVASIQGSNGAVLELADSTYVNAIWSADDNLTIDADRTNAGADSYMRFRVDTSEKMRIDSDGNVGIGTDNPTRIGTGVTTLDLKGNDASEPDRSGGVYFTRYDGTKGMYIAHNNSQNVFAGLGTYPMVFRTNNTEAMRIDSSGFTGIGTSSPDKLLHIAASSTPTLRIENTDTTAAVNQSIGKIEFEGQDSSTNASGVRALIDAQYSGVGGQGRFVFQLAQENSASLSDSVKLNYSTQQFFTQNTERMRIDSSGNLLVGRTSVGSTGNGHSIRGGDSAIFSRDASGETMQVCRNASDGQLIQFKSNGTTVGIIGTQSGRLVIGSGDTGLRMAADVNNIVPWNTTTNLLSDAAIDLGGTTQRFKDLYLSGTAKVNAVTYTGTDGTSGQVLTTDGSGNATFADAGGGGGLQSMQVFTSSGTWTKPAGISKIKVTVVGGGGGGGGGSPGFGGGAGGASIKFIDVSAVSSVTLTVGSGGSGVSSGTGGTGGTSSFSSYLSSTGGSGGDGSNGGDGGAGSSGDINISGQSGDGGVYEQYGGLGGASILGGGGRSRQTSGNYGGGGGGGYTVYINTYPSGAGSSGIVIVEEYA